MDEQAGGKPAFAVAEVERARASLRGRPQEAAVYNAWMEAIRIVDAVSMDALVKALATEKRLVWVISSVTHLLRQGSIRRARQMTTKILTPAEWAAFPAAREKARRALMAEETISFDQVVRYQRGGGSTTSRPRSGRAHMARMRKGRVRSASGGGRGGRTELDLGAVAEIVRADRDLGDRVHPRRKNVTDSRRVAIPGRSPTRRRPRDEAECTLLELVEAGCRGGWSWVGRTIPPQSVPRAGRELQEAPPECLPENGLFLELGGGDRGRASAGNLARKAGHAPSVGRSCQSILRVFLVLQGNYRAVQPRAGPAIFPRRRFGRRRKPSGHRRLQPARGNRAERAKRRKTASCRRIGCCRCRGTSGLPLIELEELEPDPEAVETMRRCLAMPRGGPGGMRRSRLGIRAAMRELDLERMEWPRPHSYEAGSSNAPIRVCRPPCSISYYTGT